jgi:hypothetical protein
MANALIEASAVAEPFVLTMLAAGLVAVLADRLFAGAPPPTGPTLDAPMARRTEFRALAAIMTVAIALRLVGWSSGLTPAFWFSEISTLHVDHWLRTHTLWATWTRLWSETAVLGPHDAALVVPVIAAVQAVVGPRFGLPILAGGFFGGLGVLLAWAVGRRVRSQAFGLLFAAFVAVSPLALTWSRLSGFCIAAGTHVLLTLLVGWEAGRRGSVLLALVTGLVAWASIHHYYPARVAIPLGLGAIVAGGQRAWRLPRAIVLAGLAAATFVAVAELVHGGRTLTALWPSYGGYAGNKGERTLVQFVVQNADSFQVELGHTVERFFARRRVGWSSDASEPGIANGGLVVLPVAALGVVGLAAVLRRVRRQWLWLLLAVAGLALPVLSVMTARRTLVFDLAWCAFAAHGLLAAVDGLAARLTRAARAQVAALAVVVIGAWATTAVFVLSAALPAGAGEQIPFGDAGFGDGVACKRCLEAAKGWGDEMADGAFVVLFDNDVLRENRTSPGGLVAYGKIAALAAGTPGRFVEGYGLMAALDLEPPTPGFLFDRMSTHFATYLAGELERTGATRIVWHFERPTAWERWLATRLVAAGGAEELFTTPLSPAPGRRVITPWARRDDALAVLREIGAGLAPGADSPCVALVLRDAFGMPGAVFGLAADGPGDAMPPEWLASTFGKHRYRSLAFDAEPAVGTMVRRGAGETAMVGLFAEDGRQLTYQLPSLQRVARPPVVPRRYALDCATFAGGRWWALDPWNGRIISDHPAAPAIPNAEWIGVAADPSGALVLAAADQSIVVFDPDARRERARFPARVSPSVRQMPDECAPIAVGAGWIATVDLRTSVLSVYDAGGRDFGTYRLDRLVRQPVPLTALAGAGAHLAVASGTAVRVFELRIAPRCSHPAPPRPAE